MLNEDTRELLAALFYFAVLYNLLLVVWVASRTDGWRGTLLALGAMATAFATAVLLYLSVLRFLT